VAEQLASARASIEQRMYDKAIETLRAVLQDSPDNAEAQALLAEAAKLKQAIELGNRLIEAQNQKAQGLLEEARQTLQKILEIDPAYQPAREVLAQLEAETSASKSQEVQDADIATWAKKATALMNAGKLEEAKLELDKIEKVRPAAPQLVSLRRLYQSKAAEAARRQREQFELGQKQARLAEQGRKANDFFKEGKYSEVLPLLDQSIAEDPQNSEALALRRQTDEAISAHTAFKAAMSVKSYDEALRAVTRLENVNPSDPGISEMRKGATTRKAAARATITIFRLAEAGTLLLDDQPLPATGGEIEKYEIRAGSHKLGVRNSRRTFTTTRDFFDGENITFVYNDTPELRAWVPQDRELINRRKTLEEILRYRVEHTHGFLKGKCTGELRISGLEVAYDGSDKDHSFAYPFKSLTLSVGGDKVEFTDLHRDKKSFKVDNSTVARQIKDRWERLQKLSK
jgi:tetratricopeptide (TPR) repeat protein